MILKFLAHKSRTVTPETRFLCSVPKRRRKAQWPGKGRRTWNGVRGLETPHLATGGPILSDLEVSCPQKPNGDNPDSVSWFRPTTPKKGIMAWKGTVGLGAGSEASKVHILLLGGPILSDLEVSCPQKPNGDAPDSVSWFRPKTPKKGTMA